MYSAGIAASKPAADAMEPAAEPEVCVMFVSRRLYIFALTTRCKAFHTANPRIAAISEPPIDQPVRRPK